MESIDVDPGNRRLILKDKTFFDGNADEFSIKGTYICERELKAPDKSL
jgi:hypothetical protein